MVKLFSNEQEMFIRENVKGLGNQELADLVNKNFELSITRKQMKNWKRNHSLSSGLTGQFKKGNVPVNKGSKGLYNVGGNKTSFKKGQKAHNYKPVGSERIDRDGYVLIKVSDDGPVPPGHKLLFADQNKQNIKLDNLILVTEKQMATLNKKGLIKNDADLTKTGILLADIYQKVSERKKGERK